MSFENLNAAVGVNEAVSSKCEVKSVQTPFPLGLTETLGSIDADLVADVSDIFRDILKDKPNSRFWLVVGEEDSDGVSFEEIERNQESSYSNEKGHRGPGTDLWIYAIDEEDVERFSTAMQTKIMQDYAKNETGPAGGAVRLYYLVCETPAITDEVYEKKWLEQNAEEIEKADTKAQDGFFNALVTLVANGFKEE